MDDARRVVLTLPAKAEYVALSRLTVSALAGAPGLDEETADDLKVAVSEACAYFIREGADSPPGGSLRLEYELGAGGIVISIVGPSVLAGSPELAQDPLSEFGLGMTIIRALVDELALETAGDHDMLLRLTKNYG